MLLEVRTKHRVFGAVAVNGCRQTVTSTVTSTPLLELVLSDLIALRVVLRNARATQQRHAEFPFTLIPTDRLDPTEEAS